jgi:hypothetical protein
VRSLGRILVGIVAVSVLFIVLIVAVNDLAIAFLVWLGVLTVALYLKPYRRVDPGSVEAARPETIPNVQPIDPSDHYFGAALIGAIVLECIAFLLFWPKLISDTVTYSKAPRTFFVYAAILPSVVIALVACAALLQSMRARRQGQPGAAAAWALAGTLGLLLSVGVGWGPYNDLNRACGDWLLVNPCPGRPDAVGLRVIAGVFWLLATLIALGTMIGNRALAARKNVYRLPV